MTRIVLRVIQVSWVAMVMFCAWGLAESLREHDLWAIFWVADLLLLLWPSEWLPKRPPWVRQLLGKNPLY